jgi:hypothetical protein
MKPSILLLIILLAVIGFGQSQTKRIGAVEFFGYSGIDLDKMKGALPFREGDELSREIVEEKKRQAREAVERITGHPPTDIHMLCCDNQGNLIIYIGLSGKPIRYHTRPKGIAQLPGNGITLYDRFTKALDEAILKGAAAEDRSKGYALSVYQPLRAIQLEMRAYAVNHETGLRTVLKTSREDRQRAAAAHLLGYARQSESQIAALAHASRDIDSTIRNNAIRALGVMAESNPRTATEIPADNFIEMLLSGTWTDLNKAGYLLSSITRGRSPDILAKLGRRDVLERLIEMARWRKQTGHADVAMQILGRIAGIDEDRLEQLVTAGDVDAIIKGIPGR